MKITYVIRAVLLLLSVVFIVVSLWFHSQALLIVAYALSFVTMISDLIYLVIERGHYKRLEMDIFFLFPPLKHRMISFVLLAFSLVGVFDALSNHGGGLRAIFPFFLFFLVSLRGIFFSKQTVRSIKLYADHFTRSNSPVRIKYDTIESVEIDSLEDKLIVNQKDHILKVKLFQLQNRDNFRKALETRIKRTNPC